MVLPPFAPVPPANLRKEIQLQEWDACMDAWALIAKGALAMQAEAFALEVTKFQSLTYFLVSYIKEVSLAGDFPGSAEKARDLRRASFLLTHRILTEVKPAPSFLLHPSFLGDFSFVFARSRSLRVLLDQLWDRQVLDTNSRLQKYKSSLSQRVDQTDTTLSEELDGELRRTAALLKACQRFGCFLMIGSDFLDSLASLYTRIFLNWRQKLITIAYLALSSLLEGPQPNVSLLIDHLYSLRAAAKQKPESNSLGLSLCAAIVSATPLLRKLHDRTSGADATRAKSLIATLDDFQVVDITRHKQHMKRKIHKGKDRDNGDHDFVASVVHISKISLVTQVQDLFPDLSSGFITKLLDEYHNNVEQVTVHLLDGSLPAHLRQADRSEPTAHDPVLRSSERNLDLVPNPTPPLLSNRRNIFDDDDFDRLAIDTSKLHLGRRDPSQTADTILSSADNRPAKTAIFSALAAFDTDDDERDDTYDIEDVGGTVDSAMHGSDDADLKDGNEEALFAAYRMTSEIFDRDATTRRSEKRRALRAETGMTDEALEGWAIMVARDPKRMRKLESKFSTFSGTQTDLAPTAYREGSGNEGSEGGARGGLKGRGRGRGRGGRGASAAGPVDEKLARQRKDAQKGSRANHNRRDQRARKMAKGGVAG